MGFGISLRGEALKLEVIRAEAFLQLTLPHGENVPGDTRVTLPVSYIPDLISGLRQIAAHLGLPLKASWDTEFIAAVLDHEGPGRPSAPPRFRP